MMRVSAVEIDEERFFREKIWKFDCCVLVGSILVPNKLWPKKKAHTW